VLAAAGVGIHLALADDLAVAGLEHEVFAPVAGVQAFESGVAASVLAHRLDAVQAAFLRLVAFGTEDLLAVAGLEVELELAVAALAHFEGTGYGHLPDVVDVQAA